MAQRTSALLPSTEALLVQLGERLRLARLRRKLTAKQVSDRAGMAPMTLRSLERGSSGVTMGAYLAVMQVLGIETDLNLIAKADSLGRDLQDAQLLAPRSGRRSGTTPPKPSGQHLSKSAHPDVGRRQTAEMEGFVDSETLGRLLDPPSSQAKDAARGL